MRAVIQRVARAEVRVDGAVTGTIGRGLLLFIGFKPGDTEADCDKLAAKIVKLRLFSDEFGKMNLSVADLNAEILCVSQFTLYADCRKGNRPSFIDAAAPDLALPLYNYLCHKLSLELTRPIACGVFGADMKVDLLNDGPVTLILES